MEYFQIKNFKGTYFGFCGLLISSCALCIMLNSSFFISNEKNSSLFTQLLSITNIAIGVMDFADALKSWDSILLTQISVG